MKHIFVVNPCAGERDMSDPIAAEVERLGIEADMYHTTKPRDATRYVAEWLRTHPGEAVRFYACGGDGTLNEVVSGVMQSLNTDHSTLNTEHCSLNTEHCSLTTEIACFPCGSGDDFVRYWSDANFKNIKALVNGTAVPVDVMQLGDRYCVNTLNYGFEAAVCHIMAKMRRVPVIGGSMAYTTGIVASLATGRHNRCRVTVDGEVWLDGEVLLLSVANGQYAGGGYHCAPRAKNDDGLLEVMAVKPMSIPRFAQLIKYYKSGELIDREELRQTVSYRRGSHIEIDPMGDSYVATDGEIVPGRRFDVHCLHQAAKFVIPHTEH